MKIKGTVCRSYLAEGLNGPNARLNGRHVIHILPEDPAVLRELDGDHQAGQGEVRFVCPTSDDVPPVGEVIEVEIANPGPIR